MKLVLGKALILSEMEILPLSPRNEAYLKRYKLEKKYQKQVRLLAENPRHPGLNVERLEPKERGIYSFRLDRKYRTLFIFRDDLKAVEILTFTKHYR